MNCPKGGFSKQLAVVALIPAKRGKHVGSDRIQAAEEKGTL